MCTATTGTRAATSRTSSIPITISPPSRKSLRGGVVEVILVTVCDEHGVEAREHFLERERKLDGRVSDGARGAPDGRPSSRRVEHRIYQNAPFSEAENDRRAAYESDLHAAVPGDSRVQSAANPPLYSPLR